MSVTDEQLAELEALAAGGMAWTNSVQQQLAQAAPSLIAEVRRLQAERDQLRAQLHRHTRTGTIGGEMGSHWPECWRTHIDCAMLEVERLRADLDACREESRHWQEYGMARNEQLVECKARLESKSLGIELRNRGINSFAERIVSLEAALKAYRDDDNWIHIPDDRGNMYWAWDGDGEPWQIATTALSAQLAQPTGREDG